MILISLDLELNQPSGTIIQIGACAADSTSSQILSVFSQVVNANEILAPEIIKLTGISQAQVDNGLPLSLAYAALAEWLRQYPLPQRLMNPLTWGGDDSQCLRRQLNIPLSEWPFGRRVVDVKTLYVAYCLAIGRPPKGGLASSMQKEGLSFNGTCHDAKDDAVNTLHMFFHLQRKWQSNS